MKKSWQTKVLLFFLTLFILANLESFILKIVESLVRIPLNINSFMTNILGADIWSRIIVATSNPIFLVTIGILFCIVIIGVIRGFDSIKSR